MRAVWGIREKRGGGEERQNVDKVEWEGGAGQTTDLKRVLLFPVVFFLFLFLPLWKAGIAATLSSFFIRPRGPIRFPLPFEGMEMGQKRISSVRGNKNFIVLADSRAMHNMKART